MKLFQQLDLDLLKEKIIENKLFVAVWLVTLVTIIGVNFSTSGTHKFVGETDSKEVNINSRHAVSLKAINVIPGQFVKKGQLLVELERKDLAKSINEVSAKLEELKAQFRLNSELNANIKSIKKFRSKSLRNMHETAKSDEDVLSIQIKNLEKDLKILLKEQEALYIFSKFDGHIGFVNFKIGESVSPFTPILTMHKQTPSFVRGYIHETLSNQVVKGKKVYIKSLSSKQKVLAKVQSVGTRIIEFPERFRRTPEIKIWGREVMIEIPKENSFLLGEKVFIEVIRKQSLTLLNRSVADEEYRVNLPYELTEMQRGALLDNLIEPSGLVYIPEINKYLMISDDNLEHKPMVYMVNHDGSIDPHVIEVEELAEIKDMEAISTDENDFIYITSSQSKSRSGKRSELRQKFVKLERDGIHLKKIAEVHLFSLLEKLAQKNKKSKWVKLLSKKTKKSDFISLDIEGLVVKNNTAYLGLRNDIGNKKEVAILKIDNIDRMFKNNLLDKYQVSVHKIIELPVKRRTDRYEGISDMLLVEDDLYLVTTSNKFEKVGRVLKTKMDIDGPVVELKHFSNHRPEGITFDKMQGELVIVFDDNSDKAPLVMSSISID